MTPHHAIVVVAALAIAGCSLGPAPIATSPRDPSNPNAPEGASPLPPANQPTEAPAGGPAHDHGQMHGTPGPAGAGSGAASPGQAVVYTCPMHPEVTSPSPGQCPKCGMNLVPKK
jgi:hypothetical protein